MKNSFLYYLIGILAVFALFFSCVSPPTDPEPQIYSQLANYSLAPDGFYPGEWAVIGVDVYGDTRTGPAVNAKVDLVFIVDESGSMAGSDPSRIRHNTIKQILTNLNSNQHRAGIITFSDNAEILGGYSQLTTNFTQLVDYLDALPAPVGFTNIAHAMQLANSLFSGSTANHRVAILLTDGFPESETSFGYDTSQDAEINTTHVPYAISEDINYYVVHLFADDWNALGTALLQDRIAGDTGGEYFVAADASQLATRLPAIVEEASNTLVLKDVTLDIQFRMGPNEYSEIDGNNIFLAGSNSYQVFPSHVTTETRPVLPNNQAITLRIPITAYEPIPSGSPPEVTEIELPSLEPSAELSYHLGDDIIKTKTIPQVIVTWLRAPEVLALKRLDPGSRRLTVSVTNFIREGPITDVKLWELLAFDYFEAVYLSATPSPQRIAPIVSNYKDSAYLYWMLGDVAPLETKAVSFDVHYHGPTEGIVAVNMAKPESIVQFTAPDASVRRLSAGSTDPDTRWYGDNTIDAAILNAAPEESQGADLLIYDNHRTSAGGDMTVPPVPLSNSLWNDAFADNGYDEQANDAAHANPEPLDLGGANKLWIRIDNRGNQPTMGEIRAEIYIKHEYCACPTDLDISIWHHLGTLDFGITSMTPGQFRVQGFEWNAANTLSPALITELNATGQAFFKVVVSYLGPELRLNNNTAVKRIPIAL
ncbi:MAG: VWA domain-containing protein [bacterium]